MKSINRRQVGWLALLFSGSVWLAFIHIQAVRARPAARWNPDPNAVIVRVVVLQSLLPDEEVASYIPEMQLWGDGRLIWVEQPTYDSRRIWTGQLMPAEMTALIKYVNGSGFWRWQALYHNSNVLDGTTRCITVQLADNGAVKEVCEADDEAPLAFYRLYRWLTHGAGVKGTPYVPATAYVVAQPILRCPTGGTVGVWPHAELGLAARAVVDDTWTFRKPNEADDNRRLIRGPGLTQLWQIARANSSNIFMVQDEGACYRVALQIPSLTWNYFTERTPVPVSPLPIPTPP